MSCMYSKRQVSSYEALSEKESGDKDAEIIQNLIHSCSLLLLLG